MENKKSLLINCLFLLVLFLFAGCAQSGVYVTESSIPQIESEKILLFGFRPAINIGVKTDLFQNPLSGAMTRAEPVSEVAADTLSEKVYSMLSGTMDHKFTNPANTKRLSASFNLKDIQDIGNAFSVDYAIIGFIYKMQERKGSELSVDTPASVEFDVYIVTIEDGSIIWKGSYNKTQSSLSENLLNFKEFLEYKGKWVTAGTLAEIGLRQLIDSMPLKKR